MNEILEQAAGDVARISKVDKKTLASLLASEPTIADLFATEYGKRMRGTPAEIAERLVNSLTATEMKAAKAETSSSSWSCVFGCHDAGWLSFVDYFRTECNLTEETEKCIGLINLAKTCGWILPTADVCFASERNCVLNRDEQGRLHCEDGPAVMYPDGWCVWSIHGVLVSEQIVMSPETLTADQIQKEDNEEVRRIMIERFGWEKYLKESGAKVADKRVNDRDTQEEVLYVLDGGMRRFVCVDPSTGRKYSLGVPREINTCEDAQNWMSHGLDRFVIHRS